MNRMIVAGLAAVLMTGVARAEPPTARDAEAMAALLRAGDTAWDAKNADAMSGGFAEDGTLRLGEGATLKGRAAVRAYFAERFAARPAGMRHVSTLERAEMVGPDLVLTDALIRLERDGTLLRRFRTYTLVERDGAGWRIKAVRSQPIG